MGHALIEVLFWQWSGGTEENNANFSHGSQYPGECEPKITAFAILLFQTKNLNIYMFLYVIYRFFPHKFSGLMFILHSNSEITKYKTMEGQ
jgi:hypothetical protein